MAATTSEEPFRRTDARFATTRWSMVLAAQNSSAQCHTESLVTLCETYWFPLYAYMRRRGCTRDEAEEHTQAFFARLLEKQGIRRADPARGRFRSFLLTAFKNFMSDERDRAEALKRGGGRKALPIDFAGAEDHYRFEPADGLTPEKLFDKAWALTVLQNAMARLADEWAARDRRKTFNQLKDYLTAHSNAVPYADLAVRLTMTEGAVRVAIHRLRKQYRQTLRDDIAQTVAAEDEIDDEIRDLFKALGA